MAASTARIKLGKNENHLADSKGVASQELYTIILDCVLF